MTLAHFLAAHSLTARPVAPFLDDSREIVSEGKVIATVSGPVALWAFMIETGRASSVDAVNAVFAWSTPAEEGVKPWRVSDPSALVAALVAFGVADLADTYAERDGAGIWLGLRDNRDALAHRARLADLARAVRDVGAFKVRIASNGSGIRLFPRVS